MKESICLRADKVYPTLEAALERLLSASSILHGEGNVTEVLVNTFEYVLALASAPFLPLLLLVRSTFAQLLLFSQQPG